MHDPHGLALNRRDLLKSIGTLSVAGSTASMFVPIAGAAEATREWTGYSICDHCNHVPSCGIKFHARGNVIESIENWKENPRHILCSKGLATLQRLYNPNRLLHPMKRTNPKGSEDPGFVRCSWEEAYRMIAENLLRIRKRYGADSVMFYAGDPKEPRPPIIRLARHFGSVHWANESSAACRAGCMQAEQLTWGRPSTGAMPTEKTRSFMIMATNVWAQPLGWWESLVKAKARGCKIITVDTRRTKAAELAETEAKEKAQYELFCKRVREMEEKGTVSYWSVLFKATSFSDLLGRLDIVNEIMDYDRQVIQDLQALQAEIEEKKTGLEASRADLVSVKAELETQKKQLSAQREEANKLVKEIDDNAAEYQATLDELEADEARIRRQAQQLQKQLEEQMKAQGKNYNTNPGGYIWPVDSRYITSTVGGRTSPGGIGSTNHKGTDIARVGYTSPVYAAKAGTVIVAKRSSSYGNYVVISHGTGNTTLYAHMSSIKVSVGTYVQQGQTIGITGSTGHSTGPHLHFEVVENGVLVNPLSHGAKPRKGYLSGYTLSGTSVGT